MNIINFGQKCININKYIFNTLLLTYYFFLSKNKFNIISFYYQGFFEIIYNIFSIFSNKKIYNNNAHF
jgi:hypothetical protein